MTQPKRIAYGLISCMEKATCWRVEAEAKCGRSQSKYEKLITVYSTIYASIITSNYHAFSKWRAIISAVNSCADTTLVVIRKKIVFS